MRWKIRFVMDDKPMGKKSTLVIINGMDIYL